MNAHCAMRIRILVEVLIAAAVTGCASIPPNPDGHVEERQTYHRYDPTMAVVLAQASDAVYEKNPCHAFGSASGQPQEGVCEWSDRQVDKAPFRAAIFGYRGDVILAFQGTVPADKRTIIADANFWPTPLVDEPQVLVHGGFLLSWLYLKPWVETKAKERLKEAKHLWITGHSLGGAQAHLAAHFLRRSVDADRIAGVYTFAAPRVGQGEFVKTMHDSPLADRVFRVENDHDLVPLVPASEDFVPVGRCVFIDKADVVQPCPHQRRLSLLLNDPDTWRSFAAAAAHKITSYSEALRKDCNKFPSWLPVRRSEECIPLVLRPAVSPYAASLLVAP